MDINGGLRLADKRLGFFSRISDLISSFGHENVKDVRGVLESRIWRKRTELWLQTVPPLQYLLINFWIISKEGTDGVASSATQLGGLTRSCVVIAERLEHQKGGVGNNSSTPENI